MNQRAQPCRDPKAKRMGDRIALGLLFGFFALSAFTMNPKGWGLFDTMAVCIFAMLGIWNLIRVWL